MSSTDADETARPGLPGRAPTADPVDPEGDVSLASDGDVPRAPEGDVPVAARSAHGRGNWRNLVISMVLMSVVVFAFVALVPRPAQRERTTVDIARSASQLAVEKGWPLGVLRPGDAWHPTSVSLAPDDNGVPTWQVGYHSRPGDAQYVVLSQTRPGGGVTPDTVDAWVTRQTRQSRASGSTTIGERTWERRSVVVTAGDGDRVRRALVARGAAAPGGLVTVLAGEVDYPTLETLAGSLVQTAVPPAASGSSPSSAAPSASSARS